MERQEIVKKLLAGWLPDCRVDDIRQAILDAWNGDKDAARYAASHIISRLAKDDNSLDAERQAERQAELDAENYIGGFTY